jgi:transcriptional repressor NrdR
MVVKKDGRREFFDRKKIIDGIVKACEKRPVSMDEVENFVSDLEKEIQDIGEREVESKFLGERIMSKLRVWDDVAYVRFASVYKQFKDLNEFMDQLQELLSDSSHNQNHS